MKAYKTFGTVTYFVYRQAMQDFEIEGPANAAITMGQDFRRIWKSETGGTLEQRGKYLPDTRNYESLWITDSRSILDWLEAAIFRASVSTFDAGSARESTILNRSITLP